MSFGPTSTSSRSSGYADIETDPPIMAEINITPLTDIFLVLLIIFMVTSSVLTQMGIQVQLPQAKQASESSSTPGIIMTVTSESKIFLNGIEMPRDQTDDELMSLLKTALAKTTEKTIVLEGDKRAVLGTIVRIMDIGKKAGAARFAVATSNSTGRQK